MKFIKNGKNFYNLDTVTRMSYNPSLGKLTLNFIDGTKTVVDEGVRELLAVIGYAEQVAPTKEVPNTEEVVDVSNSDDLDSLIDELSGEASDGAS